MMCWTPKFWPSLTTSRIADTKLKLCLVAIGNQPAGFIRERGGSWRIFFGASCLLLRFPHLSGAGVKLKQNLALAASDCV